MVGSLALLFAGAYGLTRLAMWAKRRLLWRVRRKLILSYVFVGVVPALLVITFFLLAGLILLFNVSSYLVQSRVRSLTDQARFLAQTAQLEVQRSATAANVGEALERRQSSTETRYPYLSLAVVPVTGLTCTGGSRRARRAFRARCRRPCRSPPGRGRTSTCRRRCRSGCPATALPASSPSTCRPTATGGERRHAPRDARRGAAGGGQPDVGRRARHAAVDGDRAAHPATRPAFAWARSRPMLGEGRKPTLGRAVRRAARRIRRTRRCSRSRTQRWVAFLDFADWTTGEPESASVAILINVWEIYNRISVVSQAGVGSMTFGQLLLLVLAVIGTLFLIIQFVALVIGFVLARQITGAVHDLFTGTQHVRAGDFGHQIPVRARDQLGELAESFNLMTGEVTTLLGEMAEKGRMEQEMFAAREIQQKLLPAGPLRVTGLAMSAFCEPAREVAGDYYDFLPITDTMTGVLIADVAGKGLAAGLYMAQLKVIVQSLARLHHEPKEFLSRRQQGGVGQPRRQELHHHVVRRDRRRAARDDVRARRPLPAHPRAGRPAAGPPQGAAAGARRPRGRPADRRRHDVRRPAAGADHQPGARRPGGVVHRRHLRNHERGVRLLRRGTAGPGGRAVRAPAVRSAALVHPRRAARLCQRRRPARRHDHDPDEDRACDAAAAGGAAASLSAGVPA